MTLYDTLGLEHGASIDNVKSAYRKLAVLHHPDKGGDAEKFKEISSAYTILSDSDKKQKYDQFGDENGGVTGGFPGGMNPHEMFSQMFGQMFGGGGVKKRSNHQHDIHVSLEDAYFRKPKNIKINLTKTCLACKIVCEQCKGNGMINQHIQMGPFTQILQRTCNICNGSGNISKGCEICKGNSINTEILITLDISKEISIIEGLGEQIVQQNETPGDLIIRIIIDEHPVFKRIGNNLFFVSVITFAESVLGKELDIPLFDGTITISIGTFGIIQPGKEYIIRGKGMSIDSDLILVFTINYPDKKINENDREVLTKILSNMVCVTSN